MGGELRLGAQGMGRSYGKSYEREIIIYKGVR